MKELERVRHRYGNVLSATPVLAMRLRLAEGDSAPLPAEGVAAFETAFPRVGDLALAVQGERQSVATALGGELGCFLATALLAMLLQREAGAATSAWGARSAGRRSALAYFGYSDWPLAEVVADELIPLLTALTSPEAGTGAFLAALAVARRRIEARRLDQTTAAIVAAAERQGIPWLRIGAHESLVQLGWGSRQSLLRESLIGDAPALGLLMARDKPSTLARLQQRNLPVPQFRCVSGPADAVAAAKDLGGRVVVKPTGGTKAMGVTIGLTEPADIERAYAAARRYGHAVMVEQHIEGADHRLLVVGGKLVAAALRIPGGVRGDGRRSVAALVEATNRDPRRGRRFEKLLNVIEIDDEARQMLKGQGLTLESVPAEGQWVPLRRVGNISQGGVALDVTERVHPANAAVAVAAVEALGLPLAGVDFLISDIARSWAEGGGAICEVNGCPGLRPHWVGDPQRDVVTPILRLAYGEGEQGRIPLAAVTGTHGKTTTARMLATICEQEGPGVGLTTTDGIQIDGQWVAVGDAAGTNGADILFADRRVRCAVLETARGGILRRGIAFDRCDVAAVTCVDEDHLGYDGVNTVEEMAEAKGRLVPLAERAVVLNRADPLVRAMAPRRREGARLIWIVPPDAAAVEAEDIEAGERVEVGTQDGEPWILHRREGRTTPLLPLASVPATEGGALPFNVVNACFAAAMALGLGLAPETVAAGLAAFRLDARRSLARFQRFEAAGRSVVLDFAHNPQQVAQMSALLAERYADRRRLCAFTGPGHRRDEVFDRVAAAVAGHFQGYVAFERVDWRRDKPAGWISDRLAAGLAGASAPDGVVAALTQEEGMKALFERSRPGDLIAVLAAEPHSAAAQIEAALRHLAKAAAAASAAEPLLAGQ